MTINVHKNKQRSCKHLKPCRKILWILNTLPNGVTHFTMPFIDNKHIKSRRTSAHKHGQKYIKLNVKVQVTSD